MPRIARAVLEGVPHHITQRGNGRQTVFDEHRDRKVYLDLLRRNSEQFHLSVWAYCLMSNHVHLVAVPHRGDSLSRALGRTHAEYAQYLNFCRVSCGHVWQARYFSCPLSGNYTWNAMAYVERNPVRANLCVRAADYEWSSARAHVRNDDLGGLLDLEPWRSRYDALGWQEMIDFEVAESSIKDQLREATLRGRPCADEDSVLTFERRLGRRLRPRPAGRPRRQVVELEGQSSLMFGNG